MLTRNDSAYTDLSLEVTAILGAVKSVWEFRDGSELIGSFFKNSLFASIVICDLRSIIEPSCVLDGDFITLPGLVNAVATLDDISL